MVKIVPWLHNFLMTNKLVAPLLLKSIGFAPKRSMPLLYKTTLDKWFAKAKNKFKGTYPNGRVYLFNDEFTRFNDTEVGIKTILLLTKLGYEVVIPQHDVSGRTFISKGFLRKAKTIANKNVRLLSPIVSDKSPLVGVEPSAILSVRDEYPELVDQEMRDASEALAMNAFTIEEFLANEIMEGRIRPEHFTDARQEILYHGHCQQKAIASTAQAKTFLSLPNNYTVIEIPSGCCGMAGSFGYEKEHYEISMKVGELVLFPAVRSGSNETAICASGTSCRHQIMDGTGKKALHPVELMYQALKEK
jgi:Fe-S oxidoreductase